MSEEELRKMGYSLYKMILKETKGLTFDEFNYVVTIIRLYIFSK